MGVHLGLGERVNVVHTLQPSQGKAAGLNQLCSAVGQSLESGLGARPLGIDLDTVYAAKEIRLESGDRLVFGSNGIIGARNKDDERFGVEGASEAVRKACEAGLSAEETIDRILAEVETFREEKGQWDLTFVVGGVG